MAAVALSELSLGETLGVTFLGVCVSSMLYGVTCLQTFSYYRSAKAQSDSNTLRSLVAVLLAFDTAHQAIVIHAVYNYLVLSFADPLKLTQNVWSLPVEVIFNATLAIILNGFLTFRIWRLSKRSGLTLIAAVLSLANFGTNLAYAIRGFKYHDLFEAEYILRNHGIAGLSISVVTELMISSTLAYYLHSRRTGLERSNDIITKLIALTITTGMLTTLFNVADLVAYITAHRTLYILFFNFMLGKLYANSLLTSLNSREYVLGLTSETRKPTSHETMRLSRSGRMTSSPRGGRSAADAGAGSQGIRIAMERFITTDPDEVKSSSTKFESISGDFFA
ncbi:hypothetical protein BD413DRAFT_617914 [Trametes elegans]|nr:hypothetical protein BD413DRAFT_617914 [Trametes elegans]